MAAPRQGLPVRLERAPHRGAAFALSNASKRARARSVGLRSRSLFIGSRSKGSSFIFPARYLVARDRKLQENRGMVRRPTGCRWLDPREVHLGQIERIDKHIDHANRITLVNEIIETFGQQRTLPTIRLLNKTSHQFPPKNHGRIITAALRFHTARVNFRHCGAVGSTTALPSVRRSNLFGRATT